MTEQTPESLEARVARLEHVAFEGDGLTRAVTRLGSNASALGEVLLIVDRNQQTLTQLGTQLNEVEQAAVNRKELQREIKTAKTARRRSLAFVSTLGLILFALIFYISDSAHDACENRQNSSRAVRDTLLSFRSPQSAALVDAGVKRIDDTLGESCNEQYFLHFPSSP